MAKSNNTSLNPAITALTGDALRVYAEEMNAIALGKRKFVDDIVQYMNESKPKHCLVLVGLKGTGKTTGLLQAIASLDAFDDTVLLTVAADVTVSREDMKNAIKVLGADAQYIFIDGATNVTDISRYARFLAPEKNDFKHILATGDDCLSLVYTMGKGMFLNKVWAPVTFVDYAELPTDLAGYLQTGGRMDIATDAVNAVVPTELCEYVDKVLVDNMWHSLERNRAAGEFRGMRTIEDKAKLRDMVYQALTVATISTLFDETDDAALCNLAAMSALLSEVFGVTPMVQPVTTELCSVIFALVYMDVFIRTENEFGKGYHYYIAQPWLLRQMLNVILPAYPEVTVSIDDVILKSAVVTSCAVDDDFNSTFYEKDIPLLMHDVDTDNYVAIGFSASAAVDAAVAGVLDAREIMEYPYEYKRHIPTVNACVVYPGNTYKDTERNITFVNVAEFLQDRDKYVK